MVIKYKILGKLTSKKFLIDCTGVTFKRKLFIKFVKFINRGVSNEYDYFENYRIKIFNFQNLSSIFQLVFSVLLYAVFGYYSRAFACFCFLLGVLLVLKLTKWFNYTFVKNFIFLYYNFCAFCIIVCFPNPILNYYYLPILFSLPLTYHKKEFKSFIIILGITITLFIVSISPLFYIPKLFAFKIPKYGDLIVLIILITYMLNMVLTFSFFTGRNFKKLMRKRDLNLKVKKKLLTINKDVNEFSYTASQYLQSPVKILKVQTKIIENGIYNNYSYHQLRENFIQVEKCIISEEKFINDMFEYNKIITSLPVLIEFNLKSFLDNYFKNDDELFFQFNINEVFVVSDKNILKFILSCFFRKLTYYGEDSLKNISISLHNENNSIGLYIKNNNIEITDQEFVKLTKMNKFDYGLEIFKAYKVAEIINLKM